MRELCRSPHGGTGLRKVAIEAELQENGARAGAARFGSGRLSQSRPLPKIPALCFLIVKSAKRKISDGSFGHSCAVPRARACSRPTTVGMPAEKVCLKAVMAVREGKGIWTGEYACSICGLRFRPDPTDPAKLSLDFSKHTDQHPAATGR